MLSILSKKKREKTAVNDAPEKVLTAYPVGLKSALPAIRPAERVRQWQLDTADSFAVRCLPLNIANNNGWELLLPGGLDVVYGGGRGLDDISIYPHGDGACVAQSHFGEGVLTFQVGYLFRTSDNVHMQISGPVNYFRDGIQALSGIIESDWSPYSTTMNYRFTRPCRVSFCKGQPFAQISLIPAAFINRFDVRFAEMQADAPACKADFERWSASRADFNLRLAQGCPEAKKQKWQKLYYRGLYPDAERRHEAHRTRLAPAPFSTSGLPPAEILQGNNQSGTEEESSRYPVTALIKLEKPDWHTRRCIDELSTKAEEVIVFYATASTEITRLVKEIPYSNVTAFCIKSDQSVARQLADLCGHDVVLTLNTEYLLQDAFWSNFDSYSRLLQEKYDGVQLAIYRARHSFATVKIMERSLSYPSAMLDPLRDTEVVLRRRDKLGNSSLCLFKAKDKLVMA